MKIIIIAILIIFVLCYWCRSNDNDTFEQFHESSELSSELNGSFPRIIFQTWKSKTIIPENMKKWSSTWKKFHPNYKYILWDDEDNRNFIKKFYPWFLPKYDSYDVMIKRADAIRYFFLYHYGGIYVDMDFECLKNLDELLKKNKESNVVLGKMSEKDHPNNIPNAIMISKPRHEFWLYVFKELLLQDSKGQTEQTTGPILLKDSIKSYKNRQTGTDKDVINIRKLLDSSKLSPISTSTKITILDPVYFYPIDWTNESHQKKMRLPVLKGKKLDVKRMFPNSYAVTFWAHSW